MGESSPERLAAPTLSIWMTSAPQSVSLRKLPTTGTWLVGRAGFCDLTLDDEWVSRRHVELRVRAGLVFARDLGSENGTTVNGQLIDTETEVRDGQTVGVGDTMLQVSYPSVYGKPTRPRSGHSRTPRAFSRHAAEVAAIRELSARFKRPLDSFHRSVLDEAFGRELGVGTDRARKRLDELAVRLGVDENVQRSARYEAVADLLFGRSSR